MSVKCVRQAHVFCGGNERLYHHALLILTSTPLFLPLTLCCLLKFNPHPSRRLPPAPPPTSLPSVAGSVPLDFCTTDGLSPLSDIFLDSNQLTGVLDVSSCLNLIILDVSFNNISGALNTPREFNHLHTVKLNNNSFALAETLNGLIEGKQVTEISIPCNGAPYVNAYNLSDLTNFTRDYFDSAFIWANGLHEQSVQE